MFLFHSWKTEGDNSTCCWPAYTGICQFMVWFIANKTVNLLVAIAMYLPMRYLFPVPVIMKKCAYPLSAFSIYQFHWASFSSTYIPALDKHLRFGKAFKFASTSQTIPRIFYLLDHINSQLAVIFRWRNTLLKSHIISNICILILNTPTKIIALPAILEKS